MDEEAATRRETPLAPRNYEGWSVADFEAHIAALKAEVARATEAMQARRASLSAAENFFRKP